MRLLGKALTFDDVLLVPAFSQVLPKDTSLATSFSRNIRLNLPLVSAAMDTVTEARLAIAIAQEGGIGIVHKNLSAKEQAAQVAKVKRYESGVLRDPVVITPTHTVRQVIDLSDQLGVSGFPVCDGGKVVGIVTGRDLRFETRYDVPVSSIMTPRDKLVTVPDGTTLAEAKALLNKFKLERLLVVNDAFELKGLITVKDITKQTSFPNAARDALGKLRVGAAVGVGEGTEERVEALVRAGVDAIVVDTAHGHSQGVIERVRWVKRNYPQIDVVGGNIATGAAALALVEAGRRRGQGRHRPGLDLHHPHRGRCRCAADHGDRQRGHGAQGQRRAADRRRRHPLQRRHRQGHCRRRQHGHDGRHVRRHRRGARRGHPVPGPQLQELPRHGLDRRDAARQCRPLFPGSHHRQPECRQAGARRHRRPRAVQGLDGLHRLPDVGRRARQHGLLRLRRPLPTCRNKAEFVEITAAGIRESHVHDVQITKEAPNYRAD